MSEAGKKARESLDSRKYLVPFAVPLAEGSKLKKVYRLVKKASKEKKGVRRGVKEVVKAIRKNQATNSICVFAGDISPIDVISHLPVLCEEASIPYIFVPSKETLGLASRTKRPTSCVLIPSPTDKDLLQKHQELAAEIKKGK